MWTCVMHEWPQIPRSENFTQPIAEKYHRFQAAMSQVMRTPGTLLLIERAHERVVVLVDGVVMAVCDLMEQPRHILLSFRQKEVLNSAAHDAARILDTAVGVEVSGLATVFGNGSPSDFGGQNVLVVDAIYREAGLHVQHGLNDTWREGTRVLWRNICLLNEVNIDIPEDRGGGCFLNEEALDNTPRIQ